MRPSPLLLDSYFIVELSFEANLELTQKGEPVKLADELKFHDLKTDVREWQEDGDPQGWTFELTVDLPSNTRFNYPYSFRVVLLGFFRVDAKYPEERAASLARANGPAMLYSAAREALASVTGRGPHPPLLLPSANFLPAPPTRDTKRPSGSKRTKAPRGRRAGEK